MLSTAERIDPRVKRTRKLLLDAFLSLISFVVLGLSLWRWGRIRLSPLRTR